MAVDREMRTRLMPRAEGLGTASLENELATILVECPRFRGHLSAWVRSGPAGKMWCVCRAAVPRARSSSVVRPSSGADERPDDQGDRHGSRGD